MELTINPEFHDLIPPISPEEYSLLEESLLNEGCRDAIVTWNDCILDGHRRHELCHKHNIGHTRLEKEFNNEQEAKIWIIHNQLARRNLPPHERNRLALLLKEPIEKAAEERKKTGKPIDHSQTFGEGRTDDAVAKIAGTSKESVRKSEVIEKEAPPEVKEAVRKGKMSVNKAYKTTRPPKEKTEVKETSNKKDSKNLSQLKFYWGKASTVDRKKFRRWLRTQRD